MPKKRKTKAKAKKAKKTKCPDCSKKSEPVIGAGPYITDRGLDALEGLVRRSIRRR